MNQKDYYKILGIDKQASTAEIKAAYRHLALKYHPDKPAGSEQRFNEIRIAYETLSDVFKRKQYNNRMAHPLIRQNISYSYRPDPSLLSVYVDKRVVAPDDLLRITFTLNGIGALLGIKGLHNFVIVRGPIASSGIKEQDNRYTLYTRYTYLLKPLKTGYLDIGPANASVNGKIVSSSYMSIKVSRSTSQKYNRLERIKETKLMSMAVAVIFMAIVLTHLLFQPDTVVKDNLYTNRHLTSYYNTLTTGKPSDYNQLQNGDSPYDSYFGPGKHDIRSYNMIRFINGEHYDAVVFLAKKQNGEVIRNEYIQAGATHVMEHIPDGKYLMRMISGVDWNPLKPELSGKFLGGFNRYYGYKVFDDPANIFNMVQKDNGNYVEYSVYEITLFPVAEGNMSAKNMSHSEILNK